MCFFLLKNKTADAICKPNTIESVFTSGFTLFSFNASCSQENRSTAVVCKSNAVKVFYLDALVFLFTQLLLILEDEYAKFRILDNKNSLIHIVIKSFKKKNRTNLKTKQTKSKQDICLLK